MHGIVAVKGCEQQVQALCVYRMLGAKQDVPDPWAGAEFAAVEDLGFGTIPAFHGEPKFCKGSSWAEDT